MKAYTTLIGANYGWNRVSQLLQDLKVEKAVDIAASTFVNREMFHSKWYLAVDLSQRALKEGLSKFPDDKALSLHASIMDTPARPNYADLVVCTYTLIFIPPKERLKPIQNLVDWLKPNGTLIAEMPTSTPIAEVMNLLNNQFEEVSVEYYHSKLSLWYERSIVRRFKHRGWKIPEFCTKLCTFFLESANPNRKKQGKNALVVARKKKKDKGNSNLHALPLEKIGYKLLRDERCPELALISYDQAPEELNDLVQNWLQPYFLEAKRVLLVVEENEKFLYQPLYDWLTAQEACVEIDEFNKRVGEKYDFVVVLNYRKRPMTFFHHELYEMANSHILITCSQSLEEAVSQVF